VTLVQARQLDEMRQAYKQLERQNRDLLQRVLELETASTCLHNVTYLLLGRTNVVTLTWKHISNTRDEKDICWQTVYNYIEED